MKSPRILAPLLVLCACSKGAPPAAHVSPEPASPAPASPVEAMRVEARFAQYFEEPHFDAAAPPSPDFRAVTYAVRGEQELRLFVFPATSGGSTARAATLLFHSGGWTRGRPEWLFGLAKRFASLGLVAVPVQYRLSKDGVTPIDAFADACAAFRWVRKHATELGVDPKRVAGWGASAGGQLAAATATVGCPTEAGEQEKSAADALLLVSGGIDPARSPQFRKLVGDGVDPSLYSPLEHLKSGAPPTLLVGGAEDSVTTPAQSEAFCSKLLRVGGDCIQVTYPGVGHLFTRSLNDQRSSVDPDPEAERRAYDEQVRFLKRLHFVENAP